MNQCKDCKYFFMLEKKSLCRRFPPMLYGKYSYAHPYVYPDGWCGEWKENEDAKVLPVKRRTERKTKATDTAKPKPKRGRPSKKTS